MMGGLEFFLARRVAVEEVPRVSLWAISHRDNFDNPLSLRLRTHREWRVLTSMATPRR